MEQIIYMKYSNGRAPQFAIRTGMAQSENGQRILFKEAEYPQGEAHLANIPKAAAKLAEAWKDTSLAVNCCKSQGKRIVFEFLKGRTLEEKLDSLLEQGRTQEAAEEILALSEVIRKTGTVKFQVTPEFEAVFGKAEIPAGVPAADSADIDMIYANIFEMEDGSQCVIDYEWTFFFPVPVEFIVYRALHYYLETASDRKVLKTEYDLFAKTGISAEMQQVYAKMEENFQSYIQGGYVSNGALYHSMGKMAVPLNDMMAEMNKRRMQVYLNDGKGFCEEHSYFIEQGYKEIVTESIPVPSGTTEIRIDPVLCDCMIEQAELIWGSGQKAVYAVNGYELGQDCYLFPHSDPKFVISKIPQGETKINVSYHVSTIEHSAAEVLMKKAGIAARVKRKVKSLIKR